MTDQCIGTLDDARGLLANANEMQGFDSQRTETQGANYEICFELLLNHAPSTGVSSSGHATRRELTNPQTTLQPYTVNTQAAHSRYTVSTRSADSHACHSQQHVNTQPTSTQYTVSTQSIHSQCTHSTDSHACHSQHTANTHMHLRKCVPIDPRASALAATRLRKHRLQSIRDLAQLHQPAKIQPPARQLLVNDKATIGQIHRNGWSICRNCLTVYPIIGQCTGSTVLSAQELLVNYTGTTGHIHRATGQYTESAGQIHRNCWSPLIGTPHAWLRDQAQSHQPAKCRIQPPAQQLLVNTKQLLVK